MKCKYCNAEYKINDNLGMFAELGIKVTDNLKYIPSCNCYEEVTKRELEKKEEEIEQERIKNKIKKMQDISIVDVKFIESKFENADLTEKHMRLAKRYAEVFLEKNLTEGIIFFGNSGTGKTYAAACITNKLLQHNKTVLAINVTSYLNKLKSDFNIENVILKNISECDLLILDDIGTEKVSDWVYEKMFLLIDTRYKTNKPIIITTNLNITDDENCELKRHFEINGKNRIKDRITEMCFPQLVVGNSKRIFNKDSFLNNLK